jgi:iron(III) transport system permease protein
LGASPFRVPPVSSEPSVRAWQSGRSLGGAMAFPWRALVLEPSAPIAVLMIVVLGLLALPPAIALLQSSFSVIDPDGSLGAFTTANYGRLLSDPRLVSGTINSISFAVLTTISSLILGGGLAWIVERTNAPWRELAYVTTFVSLAMPGVLAILAWLFLLGRTGPLNELWRTVTGDKDNLFNVYSMSGMVVIDTFSWLPFVFLLFSAAFRAASADFEDAARMSGASLLDTLRRISLPLARPAILATALFVFIRTLQEFDVPLLIGGPANLNFLTTEIYRSINQVPSDFAHASAFSVALTVTTAILMYFYGRMARHANKFATVTGKNFQPRTINLGRWRWCAGALIGLQFLVVVGLPLLALAWVSLMPYVQAISVSGVPLATFANYAQVLQDERYLRLGLNTVLMAGLAATSAMLLMGIAGWLVARRKPGGTLLNQLATMPLLIPGIVLGVSMMQIALRSPIPLYGTFWIIIIAYVVCFMPYGMRYTFSGVLQIHRELEEAANVAGAGALVTLRRIVAPLLLPALVSGWLLIFLNAGRELSIAVVLAGPKTQTMSVAIFETAKSGQFTELAALGLVWTLAMTVFALCFYILMRRRSAGAFGG